MKTKNKSASHYPAIDDSSGSIWDLRNLLQVITDRLWLLILCVIIVTSAGVAYLMMAPKVYEAHALLYVEQRDKKVVPITDIDQQDLESMDMMKTVEQSLTNDELLLDVAKKLDIVHNSEFLKPAPTPAGDDEVIKALSKHLKVKVRRGTRLIDISAHSRDPATAQKLVDTLIGEYQAQNIKERTDVANAANGFLIQQVDDLKNKLESAERDLEEYREKNNAVSLEEKQNIVVDTLKDLNLKLGEAQAEKRKLESDLERYQKYANDPRQLLSIPSIATDPSVMQAQRAVDDQQGQIAGLARVYRPDHPKYQVAQAQLNQLQADLDKTILNCGAGLTTAYQAAASNETKLEQALKDQEAQAMELGKISIPYNVLTRNVEVDRTLYEAMVTRMKETAITGSLGVTPVRILAPSRLPSEPASPRPKIVLIISVFLGFVSGISLCTLFGSLDPSVRSLDEAEDALGLPVLATVPNYRGRKGNGQPAMVKQPNSTTAEAFRSLRTVLELKETTDRQVLLFTSANPGDGKTFCAVNTAVALAQEGYRTLIVDTDLRHPSVANALGLARGTVGIVECLGGRARLEESIIPTGIPNLWVLPAGRNASNNSALPSSQHLAEFFQNPAFASFHRVVLDTAPVNAVSDALHLVKHTATSLCMVIRAGRTPVRAAHRALDLLGVARAKDIGLVLNCMPTSRYHQYGGGYREARKAVFN